MSKENKKKQISFDMEATVKDCVVFMTAYNINMIKKKLTYFKKNDKLKDLLSKHRISILSSNGNMLTQKGKLKYTTQFNPNKQSLKFHFTACNKNENIEKYQDEINQMSWFFSLTNSMELLLDKALFDISEFINMERFLVSVNSRLLQVDPIVFFLNSVIYVNYELIDYSNGVPLNKDEIYGKGNNYNIIPVDGVQYFDESEMTANSKSIPHVIFENVAGFIEKLTRHKFQVENYSYVHNIFVLTDTKPDLHNYFSNVLGAEGINFELNNINTNNAYEYYSQDFMGVVIAKSNENRREALFSGQLLEAFKMHVYLKQIIGYDLENKLTETINRQKEIDLISFACGVPIITINTINNIKNTESFKRRKEAIGFKISYLGILHERKKNRNALLLNVLLYILSFIGGISTLPVLQDEFGWSFKCCFIVLTAIFAGFGVLWVWKERKN